MAVVHVPCPLSLAPRGDVVRGIRDPDRHNNRHRRLDKEAALLTRQAEADAHRWDDSNTLSSLAPRSPSSSPGRHHDHPSTTTVSYSSRYDASSSSSTPSANKEEEGGRQGGRPATAGFMQASSLSSRPVGGGGGGGGGPTWRFRSGAGVTGEDEKETWLDAGGSASSTSTGAYGAAIGGGGMEAAAISWDRELASTLAREGPAAPGWPSRWRPGMPGSRAALGLWERAGGLDGDGGEVGTGRGPVEEAEISPRQSVDTAQEVSEGREADGAGCEPFVRFGSRECG